MPPKELIMTLSNGDDQEDDLQKFSDDSSDESETLELMTNDDMVRSA